MKIYNSLEIRKLKPCESGIVNFETHYPEYEGTVLDILLLDNIPHSDKTWLASKTLQAKTLQMWSVKCSESVLSNFEKVYPNDTRLKDCLEVVKKVIKGELSASAASAAWSAAWSAESAAWSAASAA